MAARGNLTFSVVLEAVTAAFNANIQNAKSSYSDAAKSIQGDSARVTEATTAASEALKKIFQATDARNIIDALRNATKELNALTEGAKFSASEISNIGKVGRAGINELRADLTRAKTELRGLIETKASFSSIEIARGKVQQLTQDVGNARAAYLSFQAASTNAMARAAQASGEASEKARQAGQSIYALLNLQTPQTLRNQIQQLSTALTQFQTASLAPPAAIANVTALANQRIAALNRQMQGLTGSTNTTAQAISGMGRNLLALTGATAGLAGVAQGLRLIVDTALEFERVGKSLQYATGSATTAAREFEYIRATAKNLGLDLIATADGYGKLAAATKGTGLEGQATRDIFLGISSAAAAMGLTVDNTSSVFLAIAQIASKGKVSMEELRGQLGERLPPAMQIAARSMGITTERLQVLVERGLDATTFLRAFGPAMVQAFAPDAARNAQSLQGTINRLRNEFKELLNDLAKGGIGAGVSKVFDDLNSVITSMRANLRTLDASTVRALDAAFQNLYVTGKETFATLLSAIGDANNALNTAADLVVGVIRAFAGLPESANNVGFITRALQGVSLIIASVNDGIAGIRIAFTAVTGVVQAFFASIAYGLSKITFGDLSKDLAKLAAGLTDASADSFKKADELALGFKSNIVKTLDGITDASTQASMNMAAGVTSASATAGQALGGMATAGATAGAQLTTSATAVVNELRYLGAEAIRSTVNLQSLGTQGVPAVSSTGVAIASARKELEIFANAGGKAVIDITKSSDGARTALTNLAKSMGIELPPAADKLKDMALALATVATTSTTIAEDLEKKLPAAIAGLNAVDLSRFKAELTTGLAQAGASADVTQRVIEELNTGLAKLVGGDYAAALQRMSKGFSDSTKALDALIGNLDTLKKTGVDTGLLVKDSLEGMLKAARNPTEIEYLIKRWKEFGDQGILTGRQVAEGLVEARKKLDEIRPRINSTEEAFRTFGLKTREEARLLAEKYLEAFTAMRDSGVASAEELRVAFAEVTKAQLQASGNVANTVEQAFTRMGLQSRAQLQETADQLYKAFSLIESSGQATAETLRKAFTAYAEAAILANNGVVSSFLQAKAAALGLTLQVSDTGVVSVDALGKTKFEAEKVKSALDDVGEAGKAAGDATAAGADKATAALDKQASAAKRAGAASAAAASPRGGFAAGAGGAGLKTFDGDVEGIASGRGGASGPMGFPDPYELYTAVKSMGGSEKLALQMQSQGKRFYDEVYLGQGPVRFFSWKKFEDFVWNEIKREKQNALQGGGADGSSGGALSGGSIPNGDLPSWAKGPKAGELPSWITGPKYDQLPSWITGSPKAPPPIGIVTGSEIPGSTPMPPGNRGGVGKTITIQFTGSDGQKATGVFPEEDEAALLRVLRNARKVSS